VPEALRLVDLEVHLEARVARLEHERVVLCVQLVEALDRDVVALPARLGHHAVQREVARVRHHVGEREVGLAERGQDAGQHRLHVEVGGGALHLRVELVQLAFHLREALAGERLGVGIELEVEEPELGRVVRVVELLQHVERGGRRVEGLVDQEHLLLGADARDPALEHVALEHALERPQLGEERAHEAAALVADELPGRGLVLACVVHRQLCAAVHSSRYFGILSRQVTQS